MERTHGGDWAAYEREYGAAPLDFSANVSPLGVPEGVRAAIAAAAGEADRYPDPSCRALCEAIAEHENVKPAQVLCGNGAAELIWRAAFAARPKRALLAEPCFGEYKAALEAAGCAVEQCLLDETFRLNEDFSNRINHNINIIVLCNPNNPTGRTIEPSLLRSILTRCGETGTRIVMDECFVGFLDEPERHTAVGKLGEAPELLILKAFTKLYALAGVRLGYALCADAAFLDAMRRAGPPWAVSGIAQAAGIAVLRETAYVEQVRRLVRTERVWLYDSLSALGLFVVPGSANFLLFQSEKPLYTPLRERGILIRRCGDFAGLDGSWYRIAVRTHPENERLIAALREVIL